MSDEYRPPMPGEKLTVGKVRVYQDEDGCEFVEAAFSDGHAVLMHRVYFDAISMSAASNPALVAQAFDVSGLGVGEKSERSQPYWRVTLPDGSSFETTLEDELYGLPEIENIGTPDEPVLRPHPEGTRIERLFFCTSHEWRDV
jgi:hypothetical protein